MREFFRDVFDYHHHFNQKIINQLVENKNFLTKRTIPLMSHLINAQQIWNARIMKKEKLGVHAEHTLEECKQIDRKNYSNTIDILNERELNETIRYTNSKGVEFNNSILQILLHISNHFSHHKGQIISDLRQRGIDPIVTDYIYYKRWTYYQTENWAQKDCTTKKAVSNTGKPLNQNLAYQIARSFYILTEICTKSTQNK